MFLPPLSSVGELIMIILLFDSLIFPWVGKCSVLPMRPLSLNDSDNVINSPSLFVVLLFLCLLLCMVLLVEKLLLTRKSSFTLLSLLLLLTACSRSLYLLFFFNTSPLLLALLLLLLPLPMRLFPHSLLIVPIRTM